MLRIAKRFVLAGGLLVAALAPASAWAHAFPVKSSPAVGATVSVAPQQVAIWFDADLDGLFSKITVTNQAGQVVSAGTSQVAADNPRLLTTGLKALAPGQYWAQWSVVARDGHHTEGRFPFAVK